MTLALGARQGVRGNVDTGAHRPQQGVGQGPKDRDQDKD